MKKSPKIGQYFTYGADEGTLYDSKLFVFYAILIDKIYLSRLFITNFFHVFRQIYATNQLQKKTTLD